LTRAVQTVKESKSVKHKSFTLFCLGESSNMQMYCRGIRGATTVESNTREAILDGTRELLVQIIEANDLRVEDVGSAVFTTTPDLDAEFPALAARQLGWHDAALMCGHEMAVPGALPRCIRILIHWNTPKQQHEIVHIYIKGARNLRPERGRTDPSPSVDSVVNP
jgi:chorismate mutase